MTQPNASASSADFAQRGRRGTGLSLDRYPRCCNMPQICQAVTGCPFVAFKERRDTYWASRPKCTECGGDRIATVHLPIPFAPAHFHAFAARRRP